MTTTFVIPTMGRKTLHRAISSITEQTRADWKALVVFDGRYDINFSHPNPNIQVIKSDVNGHAGLIRNYGIELVDTEWTAFLDDDDWIDKRYMERLAHFSDSYDVIIFTYKDKTNKNIQPPLGTKDFKECQVGISFAVRTEFLKSTGIRFTPYAVEDFRFLDECRSKGARYIVTNEIMYYVGGRGGWLRKD